MSKKKPKKPIEILLLPKGVIGTLFGIPIIISELIPKKKRKKKK